MRLGSNAWNQWRRAYPVRFVFDIQNTVNFSRKNFIAQNINLSGCELGDHASFEGSTFGVIDFEKAVFGCQTNFDGVKFNEAVSFENAQFGDRASFIGAKFNEIAVFSCALFDCYANFESAHFERGADFSAAQFSFQASFVGAHFANGVSFDGCQFSVEVHFEGANFSGHSSFIGKDWGSLKNYYGEQLNNRKLWSESKNIDPNAFAKISFAGAIFFGILDCSNRKFEAETLFGLSKSEILVKKPQRDANDVAQFDADNEMVYVADRKVLENSPTKFLIAPEFYNCKIYPNTSFQGAEFPNASGGESAARAYRALKHAFIQQQATREEQRFFKLEMAEEAKAAENNNYSTRWLYAAYRKFSDFGFSVRRPGYLLLTTTLFALLAYSWQAELVFCMSSAVTCAKTAPLLQFSFASAFPGFEKLAEPAAIELFGKSKVGTANVGVFTVITLLIHKAISLLSLFLIGLALRNLFKMK